MDHPEASTPMNQVYILFRYRTQSDNDPTYAGVYSVPENAKMFASRETNERQHGFLGEWSIKENIAIPGTLEACGTEQYFYQKVEVVWRIFPQQLDWFLSKGL